MTVKELREALVNVPDTADVISPDMLPLRVVVIHWLAGVSVVLSDEPE